MSKLKAVFGWLAGVFLFLQGLATLWPVFSSRTLPEVLASHGLTHWPSTLICPLKQEGVRWFYWMPIYNIHIQQATGQRTTELASLNVFMALERPTHTNYQKVSVVGGGLMCQIKASHPAGALAFVEGDMRGRTVEIIFSKAPIR